MNLWLFIILVLKSVHAGMTSFPKIQSNISQEKSNLSNKFVLLNDSQHFVKNGPVLFKRYINNENYPPNNFRIMLKTNLSYKNLEPLGMIFHRTLQKIKEPSLKDEKGLMIDSRIKAVPQYREPSLDQDDFIKMSQFAPFDSNMIITAKNYPVMSKKQNKFLFNNLMSDDDQVKLPHFKFKRELNEVPGKKKPALNKLDLIKLIVATYPNKLRLIGEGIVNKYYNSNRPSLEINSDDVDNLRPRLFDLKSEADDQFNPPNNNTTHLKRCNSNNTFFQGSNYFNDKIDFTRPENRVFVSDYSYSNNNKYDRIGSNIVKSLRKNKFTDKFNFNTNDINTSKYMCDDRMKDKLVLFDSRFDKDNYNLKHKYDFLIDDKIKQLKTMQHLKSNKNDNFDFSNNFENKPHNISAMLNINIGNIPHDLSAILNNIGNISDNLSDMLINNTGNIPNNLSVTLNNNIVNIPDNLSAMLNNNTGKIPYNLSVMLNNNIGNTPHDLSALLNNNTGNIPNNLPEILNDNIGNTPHDLSAILNNKFDNIPYDLLAILNNNTGNLPYELSAIIFNIGHIPHDLSAILNNNTVNIPNNLSAILNNIGNIPHDLSAMLNNNTGNIPNNLPAILNNIGNIPHDLSPMLNNNTGNIPNNLPAILNNIGNISHDLSAMFNNNIGIIPHNLSAILNNIGNIPHDLSAKSNLKHYYKDKLRNQNNNRNENLNLRSYNVLYDPISKYFEFNSELTNNKNLQNELSKKKKTNENIKKKENKAKMFLNNIIRNNILQYYPENENNELLDSNYHFKTLKSVFDDFKHKDTAHKPTIKLNKKIDNIINEFCNNYTIKSNVKAAKENNNSTKMKIKVKSGPINVNLEMLQGKSNIKVNLGYLKNVMKTSTEINKFNNQLRLDTSLLSKSFTSNNITDNRSIK